MPRGGVLELLLITIVAMRMIVRGRELPALIFLFSICPGVHDKIFASTGIADECDFLELSLALGGGHGSPRKICCIPTIEYTRPKNLPGFTV
jgi:hypothetical protein